MFMVKPVSMSPPSVLRPWRLCPALTSSCHVFVLCFCPRPLSVFVFVLCLFLPPFGIAHLKYTFNSARIVFVCQLRWDAVGENLMESTNGRLQKGEYGFVIDMYAWFPVCCRRKKKMSDQYQVAYKRQHLLAIWDLFLLKTKHRRHLKSEFFIPLRLLEEGKADRVHPASCSLPQAAPSLKGD